MDICVKKYTNHRKCPYSERFTANYGHLEMFDFKNALMGSEKLRQLYSLPKVKIGFCGHNHRSAHLKENNCDVYNISMEAKQPFLEMEI